MHELSIAQNILEILLRQAQERGFQKVVSVHLKMGRLAGIEPESLRFCFEVLSANTLAQSASLDIEMIPPRGKCPRCREEFDLEEVEFLCPRCNDLLEVTSGREMHLDKMEVE